MSMQPYAMWFIEDSSNYPERIYTFIHPWELVQVVLKILTPVSSFCSCVPCAYNNTPLGGEPLE